MLVPKLLVKFPLLVLYICNLICTLAGICQIGDINTPEAAMRDGEVFSCELKHIRRADILSQGWIV